MERDNFWSNLYRADDIRTQSTEVTWWKNQFRKTPRWINFQKNLIIARGFKCERCKSTDQLLAHHRDPIHYDDLKAEKFSVLCNSCHLIIESQCRSEEQMRAHPENRKWHTFYPYNKDAIKWQSGTGTQMRWLKERRADINKPEYTPTSKQAKEAFLFMKEHPELFL